MPASRAANRANFPAQLVTKVPTNDQSLHVRTSPDVHVRKKFLLCRRSHRHRPCPLPQRRIIGTIATRLKKISDPSHCSRIFPRAGQTPCASFTRVPFKFTLTYFSWQVIASSFHSPAGFSASRGPRKLN